MKLGVSLKIDVTKIEKARLFEGKNGGKYLDATFFIDPENPSQYGDHGMVTQDVSKEERESGTKGPILGNVKVFWQGEGTKTQGAGTPPPAAAGSPSDDIPFAPVDWRV